MKTVDLMTGEDLLTGDTVCWLVKTVNLLTGEDCSLMKTVTGED